MEVGNLVVSRKPGEHIVIGENIRVYVVEVRGSRVMLGVDAPDGVKILRTDANEKGGAA